MTYKRCTRCVMTQEGDPTICFDNRGVCNYCSNAIEKMNHVYFPNSEGEKKVEQIICEIKKKNSTKKYDCIMGISGGLDSCYLAYLGATKWNLRILALHVSDGYDTEICESNIAKLCKAAGISIINITPDKKQYNELERAFMLAGVPNLAMPQDNIINTAIYKYARQEGISEFLTGSNFALESILQSGHTHRAYDVVNIKDINRRFGREKIDKLSFMTELDKYINRRRLSVVEYSLLDFIDYNRERALKELKEYCGFEYYGSKHLENYLTGFLQLYWLPKKFSVDKRTSHLSSMIVSGQLTRDEALEELQRLPYPEGWLEHAIDLIKREMGFSNQEFEAVMSAPTHEHEEYKTDWIIRIVNTLRKQ